MPHALILLGLVLCCLPVPSNAKVFQRWPTRGRAKEALKLLGGTSAYAADMHVNGQPAKLMLYSLPNGVSTTIPELAKVFGASSVNYAGGSLGEIRVIGKQEALRLLVFDVSSSEPRSLVIAISQSRDAFDHTSQPQGDHPIPQLPAYPDAIQRFHAANADTRTQIATMTTRDAPDYVKAQYLQALEADGWAPGLSSSPNQPQPLLVYIKQDQICLVATSPTHPHSPSTTITMLHKQLDSTTQVTP